LCLSVFVANIFCSGLSALGKGNPILGITQQIGYVFRFWQQLDVEPEFCTSRRLSYARHL